MSLLSGIGSILGGLGGLFGKKDNTQGKSAAGIMGQAQGAIQAAQQYGFNPLTLLGASSPISGDGRGSTPPLASAQVLLGGLQDVADVVAGPKAQAKSQKDFMNDHASLRVDPYRRDLYAMPASAVAGIGQGQSPLGAWRASRHPLSCQRLGFWAV